MQQPIVVQKYGGSSVADVAKLKQVARRVVSTREQGKQVVVVVSAMGKTTDQLLSRAHEVSPSPSRRELDMLLTCGERMSMALLSMAVQELGCEAVSLTGSQCGIITNDRHSGARIIEVRPIRVQDELDRGRVVVVAGFQGVSYKREVTTLGRGGSDTTAVALAAALGAEYCEICSDVDGVYSADPRVVSGAQMLEAISCDQMLELAAHGAKVLHPGCVEIARRTGIALYARATALTGGGTRVDLVGAGADVDAVGVTGQKRLVRVRAEGERCVERVLAAAVEARVPALHLDTDMASADLWLALADVPDWAAIKQRFQSTLDLDVLEGVGAVSVVGDGIGGDPVRLERARAVARTAGVEVVAMTTSPLRVSLFCREEAVDELVQALHHEIIEKPRSAS
ncbi:aspartate kinase [Haliangium sp.]|uniref:aspartate kinase n=1 Tax=Haliangium sp. TaxID=2663208 RepID=UPI003D107E9C